MQEVNRGGLSFAPTDFAIRRLLWEAFADNVLEELIVINPKCSVADMAADLTHFEGEVLRYDNLGKFLEGLVGRLSWS